MSSVDYHLVLNTCPDEETARRLARDLVGERLVACVNLLPRIASVYRWEGKVEEAEEWLLLAKTTAARLDAVCEWLADNHPYRVPEVIAVPITAGLPAYLAWIDASVEPSP